MRIRYMCTVHPHEREFPTPPPRTPICCGKPMRRMTEDEEGSGEGQDSGEQEASTAGG